MNIFKSLLLAVSMLILSANVFAAKTLYGDYSVHHVNKVIRTEALQTREAAYAAAFDKLNQLKEKSGAELTDMFYLYAALKSDKEKATVSVDDGAYIKIEELMNGEGQLVYIGLLNLSYSYSQAN